MSIANQPGLEKSLDRKLRRIVDNPACGDFILADAKDADMAFGVGGLGVAGDGRPRTLDTYRQQIRENVQQGLLDIMLMSASTVDALAIRERLFERSGLTPAARANDTTDIHLAKGASYAAQPSRPFRTAILDHVMYGRILKPAERAAGVPLRGADLGLYSITFNNDLDRDLDALERYKQFRIEAEEQGFRHFLEIFNPNACGEQCPGDLPSYLNDMIVRTLAGVAAAGRPIFLKIPYHGPAAMERLASWDRSLVPGILGGASGTTMDAFHQLWEARKYGARVALYGRMINHSEHQPTMIQHLRWIADGQANTPAEAVRSYHGALAKLSVKPFRTLEDDLKQTPRGVNYSAGSAKPAAAGATSTVAAGSGEPDFTRMSPAEKIAWQKAKWDRVLES